MRSELIFLERSASISVSANGEKLNSPSCLSSFDCIYYTQQQYHTIMSIIFGGVDAFMHASRVKLSRRGRGVRTQGMRSIQVVLTALPRSRFTMEM